MKKIFIRSPYFIEINEPLQTSAKIEIFLWNKGTSEPTTPNYILSKDIPSSNQRDISWNVSEFAKGFIKPVAPVIVLVPTEEDVKTWCYMKVKRYSDNTLLDTETFVCLNGYNAYGVGYNYSTTDEVVPLINTDIKFQVKDYTSNYVNIFFEEGNYDADYDLPGVDLFNVSKKTMYKIPIKSDAFTLNKDDFGFLFNIFSEQICEPKYTPLTCTFINRFGGWQYLTFFKANSSSIDVTSKDFNLLPSSINYNVLQGQKQRFNFQGMQKVKANTGWVNENYFDLIQDLMLSETVLLDNKPVIVKSQSSEVKTHIKDKMINYEIEFEYNYGLINDVI
jgi:hypothetical protein